MSPASASINLDVPERALAIGAHPDDIEFGCGATLAKWAAAGCHVTMLVLTDGSKGTWDAGTDPMGLLATRQLEQKNAAAALGASGVYFLGRVDGELVDGRAEQAEICELIRTVRPDVVLGHDPWKRYRLHPDHRRRLAHARRHRRRARPALLPRSAGRTAPSGARCSSKPKRSTISKMSTRGSTRRSHRSSRTGASGARR